MRVGDDAIQVDIEWTLTPSLAAYYVVHMVLREQTLHNTTAIPNMRCAILCICRHSTQPNVTHGPPSISIRTARIKQGTVFFLP